MSLAIQLILLAVTTFYHAIALFWEDRQPPPGQRIDVGGYKLHYCVAGTGKPTILLDHSLGGIEGYFLIEELAKFGKVCIYDRAGYGWSDCSPHPRTSKQIVKELDTLLTRANLEPPYLLIGDSFGSYNMRLYARTFPDKVCGIVLTDALYEEEMLALPPALKALKLLFLSGFLMSILGSSLGLVRILKDLGIFEVLKPELRRCNPSALSWVKRSFCRSKHWRTMAREILSLEESARQLLKAPACPEIPIASIKAASFFTPSLWTTILPLKSVNNLRDKIHIKLSRISQHFTPIEAENSSHFVWIDRPDRMIAAVRAVLAGCQYLS